MKWNVVLAVIALSLVFSVGCEKKKEPVAPTAPAGTMEEAAKTAVEGVKAAAEEVKQVFTSDVDMNKSVDALKAEADKMDVASLKQVALKYKDAITSKQGEIKTVTDKLAAIPATQKLGAEAQQLTAETTKLTESLKALTDRFNVYVSALKAKGGDVAGLTL